MTNTSNRIALRVVLFPALATSLLSALVFPSVDILEQCFQLLLYISSSIAALLIISRIGFFANWLLRTRPGSKRIAIWMIALGGATAPGFFLMLDFGGLNYHLKNASAKAVRESAHRVLCRKFHFSGIQGKFTTTSDGAECSELWFGGDKIHVKLIGNEVSVPVVEIDAKSPYKSGCEEWAKAIQAQKPEIKIVFKTITN